MKRDQKIQAYSELESLVADATAGSRDAFQTLVTRFQEPVFRMIFARIRSTMETQDLTQEVFYLAYKKLPGLKSNRSFKSWLFSIAVNKVRDHVRQKKVRALFRFSAGKKIDEEKLQGPCDLPEAESTLRRKEFWQTVERMMQPLSAMEQEVFMLRFFDHLGIREIARALEKGESTVKTHLYRALSKLRKNSAAATLMEGGLK